MRLAKRRGAGGDAQGTADTPLALSDQMIELIARRFRMLGEPVRLRILQALEAEEQNVGQLVATLHGNQSNISRHLLALHDAGIVGRRKAANNVFYSIADPVIVKVCRIVCQSEAIHAGGEQTEVVSKPKETQKTKPAVRKNKGRGTTYAI